MVDTSVVGDVGTVWALAAQLVIAGFMGALWLQHGAHWRTDRGNGLPFWLMLWAAALAMLFLLNGLLTVLPVGLGATALHFVRAQVLQATVLLALPVVKSFTRGRPIHRWVAVASAMFVGRAALWLWTDMIWVHAPLDGMPQNGRLMGLTFLAPLAVVAWYVATSTTRLPKTHSRTGLQLASSLSLLGLIAAYLIPPGALAEILKGAWALPLVAALHVMAQRRIRVADQRALRQHRLRDALTEIGNAAWLTTDRATMLQLAEATAREQVGDHTLVGSMSPGSRGQFSATFDSPGALPKDNATKDFLDDLGGIVSVAAERMRLADNLRQESLTDYLTRLPNRKALELHLKRALVRADQKGTRLALLYCDVDEFKSENDQHGHAWGDELLQRITCHLQASLSEGTFVARVGGDEFVVVIEDARSREDLVKLARTIRTGLDLPGTGRIPPLLSVGVAVWTREDGTDPDLLLREADAAMFEGKLSASGVVVFDDALRAQLVAEQNLGREIDAALLEDQFELHYQPIVDARTLEIVGVEALIRWPHGDGMRMPAQWIPFAEKTGQIVPVGRWVVVAARAAATRFRLPVAVNVAARQLAEPRFLEHLREDWGNDDWQLLTLEITESDLLRDLSHVIESLTAVRALGARISIDDFGTGYSSFARLASLPVDVLKIDQAFVRDLENPGGIAIVRAIVALADAYGLDIVAEGVERIEQLDILTDLGVPHLQGYLLGRPSLLVPQFVDLPKPGLVEPAGVAP
jgi:diguanylate cyclase